MNEKALSSSQFKELYKALLSLNTAEDCKKFMRDICTIKELETISERLQVVKRLKKKEPYRSISKETGASTTTVSRIAYWLHHGTGGYELILKRLGH
jgi:TrpR-related protein YerC/YecD